MKIFILLVSLTSALTSHASYLEACQFLAVTRGKTNLEKLNGRVDGTAPSVIIAEILGVTEDNGSHDSDACYQHIGKHKALQTESDILPDFATNREFLLDYSFFSSMTPDGPRSSTTYTFLEFIDPLFVNQ